MTMYGIFNMKTNQLDCDPEPMVFGTMGEAKAVLYNSDVFDDPEDYRVEEIEALYRFEDYDGSSGEVEVYATKSEAVDAALMQWGFLTPREKKGRLNTMNGAVFSVTEIDKDGEWVADVWDIHDHLEETEEEEVNQ